MYNVNNTKKIKQIKIRGLLGFPVNKVNYVLLSMLVHVSIFQHTQALRYPKYVRSSIYKHNQQIK